MHKVLSLVEDYKTIFPKNWKITLHNVSRNGWLSYDHRLMYKKYITPLPYLWDEG